MTTRGAPSADPTHGGRKRRRGPEPARSRVMAVSKRLRYEVFQRDNFTCRYCGRSAPLVVLEPDHVMPRVRYGKDVLENLALLAREAASHTGHSAMRNPGEPWASGS